MEKLVAGSSWSSNSFLFQDGRYAIYTKKLLNTLEIGILHSKSSIKSTLHLLPAGEDSTSLQWTCSYPTSLNPVARIQYYRQAIALKSNMAVLLSHFKSFAEKQENIYGITIRETVFKDSFLISTKKYLAAYHFRCGDLFTDQRLTKIQRHTTGKTSRHPHHEYNAIKSFWIPVNGSAACQQVHHCQRTFFNQRIPLNRFWSYPRTWGRRLR